MHADTRVPPLGPLPPLISAGGDMRSEHCRGRMSCTSMRQNWIVNVARSGLIMAEDDNDTNVHIIGKVGAYAVGERGRGAHISDISA